jgi:hypothetical protein
MDWIISRLLALIFGFLFGYVAAAVCERYRKDDM